MISSKCTTTKAKAKAKMKTTVTIIQRFKNMGKWLIIFIDAFVYIGNLTSKPNASVDCPLSAYFMVKTKYDVKLMTDAHKEYVLQQVAMMGIGSMLALFACGLGLLGQFSPEDVHSQIELPGF